MSDASLPTLGDLSPEKLLAVTELCEQFKTSWKAWPPRIEDYLEGVDPSARNVLLVELVKLESALRREQGETATLEDFRARFPHHPWLGQLFESDQQTIGEGHERDQASSEDNVLHETMAFVKVQNRSVTPTTSNTEQVEAIGPHGYELLEVLGRGGMGVVYKARQTKLDRIVALKMIRAGVDADEVELTRFRVEAEAIARLQHPNIVQIFEIGDQENRPFISLEFCSGGSLDATLTEGVLPAEQAASLVETLARAMQEAHRVNVIHRDLKPANVLLTDDGSPKVTDFGLAKKLDDVGQTQSGALMGTPSYMAPEQAKGQNETIGPAVDIYALGAILYECLTGRPPFKAATMMDTLVQVAEEEPVSPRQLNAKVPADLETICLKCLHKEPGKRYRSAEELGQDLRRFQEGKAIVARPFSPGERLWRWCRRNPALAALQGLAGVLFLTALVFAWNAYRYAQEANREKEATRRHLHIARIQLAQVAWRNGEIARMDELLEQLEPKPGQEDLRGFDWNYLWRLSHTELRTLRGHTSSVGCVAFRPDGQHLASASDDRSGRVWEANSRKEVFVLRGHEHFVRCVAYSPTSTRLATIDVSGVVKIWDAQSGRELQTLKGLGDSFSRTWICWDPTGKYIAGCDKDKIQVWNAKTGKALKTFPTSGGLAFSPNGEFLAYMTEDKMRICDPVTGQEKLAFDCEKADCIAFGPKGVRIATANTLGEVKIWSAKTGQVLRTLQERQGIAWLPTMTAAFSPDGRYIVAGGQHRKVRVWDVRTGKIVRSYQGHKGWVSGVCFSPDGRRIASAGDRTVKVWALDTVQGVVRREGATIANELGVVFAPKGEWLIAETDYGLISFLDPDTLEVQRSMKVRQRGGLLMALSPDGERLAVPGKNATSVEMRNVSDGKLVFSSSWPGRHGLVGLSFTPDGTRLVTLSLDGTCRVWDASNGKELFLMPTESRSEFHICPDGNSMVVARGRFAEVWDFQSQEMAFSLEASGVVNCVEYSPDGKSIVAGTTDGELLSWNAVTRREQYRQQGHRLKVRCLAFSRDGNRIASGSEDGTVKVWDAVTGGELLSFQEDAGSIAGVVFHPEGKCLAAGTSKAVLVWPAETTIQETEVPSRPKTKPRLVRDEKAERYFRMVGEEAYLFKYRGGPIDVAVQEKAVGDKIAPFFPLREFFAAKLEQMGLFDHDIDSGHVLLHAVERQGEFSWRLSQTLDLPDGKAFTLSTNVRPAEGRPKIGPHRLKSILDKPAMEIDSEKSVFVVEYGKQGPRKWQLEMTCHPLRSVEDKLVDSSVVALHKHRRHIVPRINLLRNANELQVEHLVDASPYFSMVQHADVRLYRYTGGPIRCSFEESHKGVPVELADSLVEQVITKGFVPADIKSGHILLQSLRGGDKECAYRLTLSADLPTGEEVRVSKVVSGIVPTKAGKMISIGSVGSGQTISSPTHEISLLKLTARQGRLENYWEGELKCGPYTTEKSN